MQLFKIKKVFNDLGNSNNLCIFITVNLILVSKNGKKVDGKLYQDIYLTRMTTSISSKAFKKNKKAKE